MSLVKRVYDEVGKLAAEGGDGEIREYIKRSAYFASQIERGVNGSDYYWFAALASATLNFLAEREGKNANPVQVRYERYMTPSEFRTEDPIGELDEEDKKIISLGFQHHFWCCVDTPKDNFWWTSRRTQVGLAELYPCSE